MLADCTFSPRIVLQPLSGWNGRGIPTLDDAPIAHVLLSGRWRTQGELLPHFPTRLGSARPFFPGRCTVPTFMRAHDCASLSYPTPVLVEHSGTPWNSGTCGRGDIRTEKVGKPSVLTDTFAHFKALGGSKIGMG